MRVLILTASKAWVCQLFFACHRNLILFFPLSHKPWALKCLPLILFPRSRLCCISTSLFLLARLTASSASQEAWLLWWGKGDVERAGSFLSNDFRLKLSANCHNYTGALSVLQGKEWGGEQVHSLKVLLLLCQFHPFLGSWRKKITRECQGQH